MLTERIKPMAEFSVKSTALTADRLSVEARRTPLVGRQTAAGETEKNRVFAREAPFATDKAEFVEADGRRYYLNAPRGTYLDILV